jgi:hypothetical protein
MKKSYAAISASTVVLMAIAGCSSTPSASSDSSASATADNTPVLKAYFDSFGTDRVSTMEPMLANSEPGSPANVYAQHQLNAATASESANNSPAPSSVVVESSKVTMQQELPKDPTDQQTAEATNTYSSFEYSPSGLITTWSTEPGGALAPRISSQASEVTSGKVTVLLNTAYATNSGDLSVTFTVRNKSGEKANVLISGYINPDGRQVKVTNTPYLADPAPRSFSTGSATIVSGKRGGKLIVQFDYQTDKKLAVK